MSKNIISDAQFSGLDGGSRNVETHEQGPSHGYYVSRDPDTRVRDGGSFEAKVADHTPEDVQAHMQLINEDGAATAGTASSGQSSKETYQGTWSEGKDRYLDVSDRYSKSTAGLMHALQHGMANTQLAMYSAHNPSAHQFPEITSSQENAKTGETEKLAVDPRLHQIAASLHKVEARRARDRESAARNSSSK